MQLTHYLPISVVELRRVVAAIRKKVSAQLARAAASLLPYLAGLPGQVYAGRWSGLFRLAELAELVGASARTVRRWLSLLRGAGAVEVQHHGRSGMRVQVNTGRASSTSLSANQDDSEPADTRCNTSPDQADLERAVAHREVEARAAGTEPRVSWRAWRSGVRRALTANPDELVEVLGRADRQAAEAVAKAQAVERQATEDARRQTVEDERERLWSSLSDLERSRLCTKLEGELPRSLRQAKPSNTIRQAHLRELVLASLSASRASIGSHRDQPESTRGCKGSKR